MIAFLAGLIVGAIIGVVATILIVNSPNFYGPTNL